MALPVVTNLSLSSLLGPTLGCCNDRWNPSLDKEDYEIDLSAANEERLREKLAKFLDAASPVGPRCARTTAARKTVKAIPASRDQTQAIREWARGAGYVVSERGRIPKNVQEAFNQAH